MILKFICSSIFSIFFFTAVSANTFSSSARPDSSAGNSSSGDREVALILNQIQGKRLPESLEIVSAHFLGRKYQLGPLGEGNLGKYNQNPLFRLDRFDCTTLIETTMALATAKTSKDFEMQINRIRYHHAQMSYVDRNHFPELDWIPNNERAGLIRDITAEVASPGKAEIAHGLINKPAWYAHKQISEVIVPSAPLAQKQKLLSELRNEGANFRPETASLPYLGFDSLFKGKNPNFPNEELLGKIPSGTIVNLVREKWYLPKAGTELLISHQGLAIRKKDALYFRNASSSDAVVEDLPFAAYLAELIHNPTVVGINLLEVR